MVDMKEDEEYITEDETKQMMVGSDDDVTTSEEAKAKGLLFLAKTGRPDLLTELNEDEIKLVTTIETLGEFFRAPLLKKITLNFKNHRVSKERKGRSELLAISKGPAEEGRLGFLREKIPFMRSER